MLGCGAQKKGVLMIWLIAVEWLARLILLGLIGLSVWSVAIIIDRHRFFKSLQLPGAELRKSLNQLSCSQILQ